jgi:hypothetical protein
METMITPRRKNVTQSGVALHLMVNQISVSTLATATRKRNLLVNEIPTGLAVNTDTQKLAAVLGSLIQSVMGQATDACIRISAKEFSNLTLVHIQDNRRLEGHRFNTHLGEAQEMARTIGGTVFVNNCRDGSTTIALSILNQKIAKPLLGLAV